MNAVQPVLQCSAGSHSHLQLKLLNSAQQQVKSNNQAQLIESVSGSAALTEFHFWLAFRAPSVLQSCESALPRSFVFAVNPMTVMHHHPPSDPSDKRAKFFPV